MEIIEIEVENSEDDSIPEEKDDQIKNVLNEETHFHSPANQKP